MSDITKVDKNFQVKTNLDKKDIKFYNVSEKPFKVHGVFKENGLCRRMPENVAKKVSEGVSLLHSHLAGGRVRFKTDSSYIAINVSMPGGNKMPHFAFTGSAGVDLYADDVYFKTFVPPLGMIDGYESIIEFPTSELREITINFPLYNSVEELLSDYREIQL